MITKDHDLITASRVKGEVVYNGEGKSCGHVHDLSIDKVSGQVRYALVSFGGFLHIGDRYHAIPWSLMHYDKAMEGYIVPLSHAELEAAPTYSHDDLIAFGDGDAGFARDMLDYYGKFPSLPPY